MKPSKAIVLLGMGLLIAVLAFYAGLRVGARRAAASFDQAAAEAAAAPAAAGSEAAAEAGGGGSGAAFAVQVGAFLAEDEAAAMIEDLAARGWAAHVTELHARRLDAVLRSVRVGPYATYREATRAADELRSEEGLRAAVVRAQPSPMSGSPAAGSPGP